ncbi:uncharacterized protein KRP23_11243 [Phytophthora ramorum]|uniref:uncharacterized protein n=1 Tax=Phytophthora ramorum TaxID=164328 RepID=UPI0030B6EE63|nr:hypothetical protein KRP23_11243 [Phytophthora ramorum]
MGSFREPEHLRRRSRQSFRSPELLASLTLSAEAITLRADSGNPEEAAARAAARRATRAPTSKALKAHQSPSRDNGIRGVVTVSTAKLMSMKKLKSMRKYRLGVHGALREEEDEGHFNIAGLPIKARRKSLVPMNSALLSGITLPPSTRKSPTLILREKHAVGKFETNDSKWKATIEGEVEKFMYPSLRLESLYVQEEPDSDSLSEEDDVDDRPMPSPKTIDEVLTNTSKVSWELEHVTPSPAPVTPVQEVDSKRVRFDQKLQDAEAILCKREAATRRLSTAPSIMEHRADALTKRKSCSSDGARVDPTTAEAHESIPARFEQSETPRQQPIPRLPRARKFIKEIQRHTTNAGQIEYYADKQHLFTKWEKVQVSQHHQQLSPLRLQRLQHEDEHDRRGLDTSHSSDDEEGENELQQEGEDSTSQPFGKLSPRSLFYHDAVAFGFFLRQNHSLRTLDMKDNSLGEVGARALLRAIALGSRCEISLSVHDLETSSAGSTPAASSASIFDANLPSASSPFELRIGESPYAFAVASELIDAAVVQGRCALSDLSYEDDPFSGDPVDAAISTARRKAGSRAKSAKKRSVLMVDQERRCLYSAADASKGPWELPARGTLRASATFMAPPLSRVPVAGLDEESCLNLIHIVSRGLSSRDMISLLDLVLADLQLTTAQATFFVTHLLASLPKMELLGRLWPCLIDGENAFAFLQQHLNQAEQWRLIDRFGPVTMQFSTANPTGHWTLALRDPRHRKIALWFASLNANHTAIVARYHPKRTDCSQYGRGFHWRNVSFNQKRIQLTYAFFDRLPRDGVLEFDYVSPIRPEDTYIEGHNLDCQDDTELDPTLFESMQVAMTDQDLAALLAQVGAEVCAVYVPVHKRQNLKYHLVLFHSAIAGRRVLARQAHHVLQHFPKNYESGRLRALVAMHHAIVDLERFGELLERLSLTDRSRVYVNLGYLSTVTPLAVDMDFEVDFTREDEKMLLRALVDLSISCPMDMIRIDSTRSTVLIIYSMYQTNTVPSTGRICFRYVSHQTANRLDWLRARQQIYRHFLCGDRLKSLSEAAALALTASASSNETSSSSVTSNVPDANSVTTPA